MLIDIHLLRTVTVVQMGLVLTSIKGQVTDNLESRLFVFITSNSSFYDYSFRHRPINRLFHTYAILTLHPGTYPAVTGNRWMYGTIKNNDEMRTEKKLDVKEYIDTRSRCGCRPVDRTQQQQSTIILLGDILVSHIYLSLQIRMPFVQALILTPTHHRTVCM